MSVSDESRFNYSPRIRVVDAAGTELENERVHLPYPREPIVSVLRPDLYEYHAQEGDTWSNIASRLLRGRSDLWWVIAEFTGVMDPFAELFAGRILKVPQFDTVMFEVLNFDDKGSGRGLRDLDEAV